MERERVLRFRAYDNKFIVSPVKRDHTLPVLFFWSKFFMDLITILCLLLAYYFSVNCCRCGLCCVNGWPQFLVDHGPLVGFSDMYKFFFCYFFSGTKLSLFVSFFFLALVWNSVNFGCLAVLVTVILIKCKSSRKWWSSGRKCAVWWHLTALI